MKTLVYRMLSHEDKALVNAGCSACIDLLYKKMKLEKWQCYLVVKTLFEEFPLEEIEAEKKQLCLDTECAFNRATVCYSNKYTKCEAKKT